ncbi:MAG: hypothetical protein IT377_02505 [Polyangiaceae bacterium]|nr:hypothetical protein [Polyangiaceae bacterium]
MEIAQKHAESPSLRIAALVAVAFGIVTVISGGRVLFGPESARVAAGAVVPFVLWFNFLAGFCYVLAGVGLWRRDPRAARLAAAIAAATALAYLAFGLHALTGGAFERRTAVAMAVRTGVWTAIAALACKHLGWRKTRP